MTRDQEAKIKAYYTAYLNNFYAKHLSNFSYQEEHYRLCNDIKVTDLDRLYEFEEEDYPVPPVPEGAIDLSEVESTIQKTETFLFEKDYEKDVFFYNFFSFVKFNCDVASIILDNLYKLVEYESWWNEENREQWRNDDTLC